MKVVTHHTYVRAEYDWLMIDNHDQLAYFSTAGAGPIPADIGAHAKVFENLADAVQHLPLSAEAILAVNATWDVSDWIDVATRGLFAYDWRWDKTWYVLLASPSVPLKARSLPADLRSAASRTSADLDQISAWSQVRDSLEPLSKHAYASRSNPPRHVR